MFFLLGNGRLIKSKQNLFSECLSSMASMTGSFLYIIQPNSQHAQPLWLFQLKLSIDWLIVRPLLCERYHRTTISHLNSTGAQPGRAQVKKKKKNTNYWVTLVGGGLTQQRRLSKLMQLFKKIRRCCFLIMGLFVMLGSLRQREMLSITAQANIIVILFFFLLLSFFLLPYNNAWADVWSVAHGNTRLVKIDIAFNISFLWQITSTEGSLDKSGNIWM